MLKLDTNQHWWIQLDTSKINIWFGQLIQSRNFWNTRSSLTSKIRNPIFLILPYRKSSLDDLMMLWNHLWPSIPLIQHTMGLYLNKKHVQTIKISTEYILGWHRINIIPCKAFTTGIIEFSTWTVKLHVWSKHLSIQDTSRCNKVCNWKIYHWYQMKPEGNLN